jgi:hypothetical protein
MDAIRQQRRGQGIASITTELPSIEAELDRPIAADASA